jgi:hypothetical protein
MLIAFLQCLAYPKQFHLALNFKISKQGPTSIIAPELVPPSIMVHLN